MALVFMPQYIEALGAETFGLVGFYIVVQMMLSVFDFGITPTLSREMAKYKAGSLKGQTINSILSSLEICIITIACVMFFGLWLSADLIAIEWLSPETLSQLTVSNALVLMGLAISLRFIEAIYKGSLIGLEEQVWFNLVNAFLATFRFGGVVIVLVFYSSSIEAFFYWQAITSFAALILFRSKTLSCLPAGVKYKRFDINVIKNVWKFASGMFSIGLLSLLLTQTDKIILSKLLTLTEFSYYTLAVTVAGSLYMFIIPITQAFYPRMVSLVETGDNTLLKEIFHQATQLVNVLILPVVLTLVLFTDVIIYAWTEDQELTNNVVPILSIYIIGSYFNGLANIPYHLQLSHGWTSLSVKMNVVTLMLLGPFIFWLTPAFGAIGVSYVWMSINLVYFVIGSLLMFKRLLPEVRSRWFFVDLGVPSFLMMSMAVIIFLAVDIGGSSRILSLVSIFGVLITIVIVGVLSSGEVLKLISRGKVTIQD
jgi:O-antigen/teichoic acid export membrane protein